MDGPNNLFIKEVRAQQWDVYSIILWGTVMKRINMFVYSTAGIAASALALEEEAAADLPADDPSPEQVKYFFLFFFSELMFLTH